MSFLRLWLTGYLHPGRAFEALRDRPAPHYGLYGVLMRGLIMGLVWYLPRALMGLRPSMAPVLPSKLAGKAVVLEVMDAQQLRYGGGSFDAVLLSLILSVVPDGAAAFREAWRVLRPGGRAVIFDKFLPEDGRLSLLRRAIGAVLRVIGADPNRRLSQLIAGAPGLVVERNEPSLLRGQYRIVLLRKES